MKRVMDIVVSAAALILLFPILLCIAIFVVLDSEGPALYLQERVGLAGRSFQLFKFRTMHVNADRLQAITVGARDPRITRVGYYLRKFKIDELPQLFNVLCGDMSLVGPRPELKKFVDLYNERQKKVISIRPGITDYASIQFRNENELLVGKHDPVAYYIKDIMPVKLELNLKYIAERSLWMDIKILFVTVFSIFRKSK